MIRGIAFLVEPLHDSHRALIDGCAEKSRYGRIALVLKRQPQRRKLSFTITGKTRIEIFESYQLLSDAARKRMAPYRSLFIRLTLLSSKQTERARCRLKNHRRSP